MASISALYVYPIKSCGGIRYDRAELSHRGLAHDRQWMVVDPLGQLITQRETPQMALIHPTLTDSEMILTAPDMQPLHIPLQTGDGARREVVVWKDVCTAVDEGEAAAVWFSQVMGVPAALVKMADDFHRLTSADYTETASDVGFADGYPILFISEASLVDLNTRLTAKGSQAVPMTRFRPNVIITDCEPYAEDTWTHVSIGGVRFDVVKPCARCVMTTVDPATGTIPDVKEPLATLASYRRGTNGGAMFGQNIIHRGLGSLSVGDVIVLSEEKARE